MPDVILLDAVPLAMISYPRPDRASALWLAQFVDVAIKVLNPEITEE